MSLIDDLFNRLRASGEKALMPFVTAGDPDLSFTARILAELDRRGCHLAEVGIPYSDPIADGPVIQKAVERALEHNVSLRDVLSFVAEFRQANQDTPVILMGYLNPIEAMGNDVFAKAAAEAGLDAVLTVDMPPEESEGYLAPIKAENLDRIFLVTPTTPDKRLQAVNEQGSGFVYYVSLKGVTGSKDLDVADVTQHVNHLRTNTDMPVGIGFGIRNGEAAYQMAKVGDAIIIGSALVNLVEANAGGSVEDVKAALAEKMIEFRQAIDKADSE